MSGTIPLFGTPCACCGLPARAHNVEAGRTWHVDPGLPSCLTQLPASTPMEPRQSLTERELLVLTAVSRTPSHQAAATQLGLTVKAVHRMTDRIRLKLRAANTAEAVSVARSFGLLPEAA